MLDDTSRVSTKSSSSVERESAPQNTATVKDYMVLSIVVMIILGDGIEFYLPGVITQNVSCDLGLSEVEESVLAVMYYFFHAITVMISLPISKRFGERMTLLLSLYLSILFAIMCAIVPNYSTLLLSRALNGICVGLNGATSGIFLAKLVSSKEMVTMSSFSAGGWQCRPAEYGLPCWPG